MAEELEDISVEVKPTEEPVVAAAQLTPEPVDVPSVAPPSEPAPLHHLIIR